MDSILNQLPRQLTHGVTATREGLEITDTVLSMFFRERHTAYGGYFITWRYVAERLRYREGEPWCFINGSGVMVCDIYYFGQDTTVALHRLAAIFCDNAEAFRVLRWCIHNLGGEQ